MKQKLTPEAEPEAEAEKATTKEEMEATANSETGAATGSSETGAATGGGNAATGMNENEKDGIVLISQELIISGLSRAVAESSKKSLTYAIATSIVVDVETVEIDSITEVPAQEGAVPTEDPTSEVTKKRRRRRR